MEASGAGTQVIDRCALLLRLIGNANQQGARLVDLWRLSGLTRPTATRLLAGLESQGLVRRAEPGKRYLLGPLVYELGIAAERSFREPVAAIQTLAALAAEIGDTVYLVRRSGDDSVCVALLEGGFEVQVKTVEVGTRRPMGSSAGGLANLMALPAGERRAVLERNRPQLEPYEALYRRSTDDALQCALSVGHVYVPIHIAPHVSALAVPVPGSSGYAISSSALDFRHAEQTRRARVIEKMLEAASSLGSTLKSRSVV